MNFEHILYEVKDAVAYITLNHPAKRNPLGGTVKSELCKAFELCDADDAVRVVVLRGAGGNFSAGGDANEKRQAIKDNVLLAREACELGARTNLCLRELRKPTIAWVEGAIAGSGLTLALACDFQVVSEEAKCTFAFVNMAIVPDCGSTCIVTRAVGTTRANELLLSGRQFSGKEGADWGLFTEAVSEKCLETRIREYIKTYKNGPAVAYASIKEIINRVQYRGLLAVSDLEMACLERCERTEDYKTAVYSFLKKEKPQFIGR